MSKLTERLLRNISYENIKNIRKQNFIKLHQSLRGENELTPVIDVLMFNSPETIRDMLNDYKLE